MSEASQLDALRAEGAHLFDPVRFHYLEALSRRLQSQPESVRATLAGRLQQALADYTARMKQARKPELVSAPSKEVSPLAQLNRHIQQQTKVGNETTLLGDSGGPSEMKSVRRFSEVWSKMVAQDQVEQAIDRGPVNAGPLNSHMLVLRSLAMARDLSPDYLRRHLSHMQALLWLDQVKLQAAKPSANKPAGRARTKK